MSILKSHPATASAWVCKNMQLRGEREEEKEQEDEEQDEEQKQKQGSRRSNGSRSSKNMHLLTRGCGHQ